MSVPGLERYLGERSANWGTKLTLTGVFLGAMAVFASKLRSDDRIALQPFELLLLGLASLRTGRMIAYERIGAPIREPFTETEPDRYGVADTVIAEGKGAKRAIGELLSCPICVATWSAAALVYGLRLAPRLTQLYLTILGAAGIAEIVFSGTEALTWTARAARKACVP